MHDLKNNNNSHHDFKESTQTKVVHLRSIYPNK